MPANRLLQDRLEVVGALGQPEGAVRHEPGSRVHEGVQVGLVGPSLVVFDLGPVEHVAHPAVAGVGVAEGAALGLLDPLGLLAHPVGHQQPVDRRALEPPASDLAGTLQHAYEAPYRAARVLALEGDESLGDVLGDGAAAPAVATALRLEPLDAVLLVGVVPALDRPPLQRDVAAVRHAVGPARGLLAQAPEVAVLELGADQGPQHTDPPQRDLGLSLLVHLRFSGVVDRPSAHLPRRLQAPENQRWWDRSAPR